VPPADAHPIGDLVVGEPDAPGLCAGDEAQLPLGDPRCPRVEIGFMRHAAIIATPSDDDGL
jgi:hypothetical protein